MNISKEDKIKILERKEKMKNAVIQLKTEFVGLNDIIDEICSLVESWYLFPNGQIRPTVINAWGMTGCGKSSVVSRLFELLDINSVVKFDVGDFSDDNSESLKYKLSAQIRKVKKDNNIPVFIFDEFQLGRTINENGEELDRSGLRVLWELLDTGMFTMVEESWENTSLIKLYTKLLYCVEDGVEVKNGKITKNINIYNKMFEGRSDDLDTSDNYLKKYYTKTPFIPIDNINLLRRMNEDIFMSDIQVAEYICTLDENQIVAFLENTMEKSFKPTVHDFSNSIIFNIGNLDEAYQVSHEVNPDIDADTLYDITNKITITDIKKALLSRYRAEQISRLGNNHVIYKSFTSEMYKDLIKLELGKFIKKIKDKFDIDVIFNNAVYDVIYSEGVFPAQGVRPIFSTIINLLESYVGKMIVDGINLDYKKIYWNFNYPDEYEIKLVGKKTITFKYPVKLKTENLRQSNGDDRQALVAIHEAGHVVASIYGLNICPKIVFSKTANNDCGGFTHVETPDYESKSFLLSRLVSLVGGYMAEKMVFGEDNMTNGSYSDLGRIMSTALDVVKRYGMTGLPVQYSFPDFRVSCDYICSDENQDKIALDLVKTSMTKTEEILKNNMKLLLKMGEYLTTNSKMDMIQIKEMVEKYGSYVPQYKTKDDFYNYKNMLEEKINTLEKKNTHINTIQINELILNEKKKKKRD